MIYALVACDSLLLLLGATGNKHNFCSARVNRLFDVCTITVLTIPSLLGIISINLPISHLDGGKFSSFMSTNMPT